MQLGRLGGPPRVLVSQGEVVAGAQGVGGVRTQNPLAVGEGALKQRDRLGGPPRGLVCGLGSASLIGSLPASPLTVVSP
jgi:hypothetical protein